MNNRVLFLAVLTVVLAVSGCRRNYKVNYSRVAIDTVRQQASEDFYAEEDSLASLDEILDDPLMTVPDIPKDVTAGQIMSKDTKEAAREAERLYSGQE